MSRRRQTDEPTTTDEETTTADEAATVAEVAVGPHGHHIE
jgi:hypothetical protein